MHSDSCFVTLTYAKAPLSLEYRDFQLFMYRLRKRLKGIRFFCVGEYGPENFRPHWHAILYGIDFASYDARVIRDTDGMRLWQSPFLDKLWMNGFASVGSCDYESAAYCAHYCVSKVDGELADSHYTRVDSVTGEIVRVAPEMARMSLKPGIGATWYDKFSSDLHNFDVAIAAGRKKRVPRYYMDRLSNLDPYRYDAIKYSRYLKSTECDDSPERLKAREAVAKARLRYNSTRSL